MISKLRHQFLRVIFPLVRPEQTLGECEFFFFYDVYFLLADEGIALRGTERQ